MGASEREMAQRLRRRYARLFQVPLVDVTMTELPDGDIEVWCSSKRELPVWTTGTGDRE